MKFQYVGFVDGDYHLIHYYGPSVKIADQLYGVMSKSGAYTGANVLSIVRGETEDDIIDPTADDLKRWVNLKKTGEHQ
jgi:hypothetical protein